MPDPVRIKVKEFYTKAREKSSTGQMSRGPDGKPIYDDMVAYYPDGKSQTAMNHARIDKISKIPDPVPMDNPAYAAAKARWDYIKPRYEAWKKGQELPEGGTPLAAANFLRREDIDILKQGGIRSLEELIALPEGMREAFRIPRIRELMKQADAFLKAADQQRAHEEIEARDHKVAALENESKEMRAKVAQLEAALLETTKRGPGRPPKEAQGVASDQ
jgi:hypothetical protein